MTTDDRRDGVLSLLRSATMEQRLAGLFLVPRVFEPAELAGVLDVAGWAFLLAVGRRGGAARRAVVAAVAATAAASPASVKKATQGLSAEDAAAWGAMLVAEARAEAKTPSSTAAKLDIGAKGQFRDSGEDVDLYAKKLRDDLAARGEGEEAPPQAQSANETETDAPEPSPLEQTPDAVLCCGAVATPVGSAVLSQLAALGPGEWGETVVQCARVCRGVVAEAAAWGAVRAVEAEAPGPTVRTLPEICSFAASDFFTIFPPSLSLT